MGGFLWLSGIESSEPVGIPVARIAMIEQKTGAEGGVVAIFLDTGQEVRVVESLGVVRERLAAVVRPA